MSGMFGKWKHLCMTPEIVTVCWCDREELQSYKDAKLNYQNNDATSAALGAGRIAHLETELREAQVTLNIIADS